MSSQRVVLFVDDEHELLNSLRRALADEPYETVYVTGGTEALDVLSCRRVDVVVADYRMPGMSGLELLHEIQTRYPDVVRILLSGQPNIKSEEIRLGLNLPADR